MSNESKVMMLTVNNEDYEVKVAPTETLADVVRERLGLTGTKIMCNQGECGACIVLMNGRSVLSCLKLAVECEGYFDFSKRPKDSRLSGGCAKSKKIRIPP